ncbi:MAG TPA: hypothetical protein VNO69_04880 [Methyloceanibacter sp.]|nr:hypothetical protein [Methyloceanibacter sp.]
MDFKAYLKQFVGPAHPNDIGTAENTQRFTKWLFDFARNVMIVGVVRYIADVTGSLSVRIIDMVLSGALIAFIFSHIQVWHLHPFGFLNNERVATALDFVVTILVSIALFSAAQITIFTAIEEIAKAQGPQ